MNPYEVFSQRPDYENPEVLSRSRLPAHTRFGAYASVREALRGDITRLLTTGESVDPERRPQMIADCTDRLRLRRLEKEIDDCQARAARPGLTLQEQVELATRLNQLYDQVERLRRGAKGGEP